MAIAVSFLRNPYGGNDILTGVVYFERAPAPKGARMMWLDGMPEGIP
jgi:hypothetical protein